MTCEATFVPGDPPRAGTVALWGGPPPDDAPTGRWTELEVVVPGVGSASGPRRKKVPAMALALADAVPWLVGLDAGADVAPSVQAWSAAAKFATGLVARGRILPAVSAAGFDVWSLGPLDPAHDRYLAALVSALPPPAHALPIPRSRPVRLRSPGPLVRMFLDATADVLARGSSVATGPFADTAPTPVPELREWASMLAQGLATDARAGLRLELPDDIEDPFTGVLQLQSAADPSLVVDASDLWAAPDTIRNRFGTDVDTDLLLTLRRATRAWPAAGRLLDQTRPDRLSLDDDEVGELLEGTASDALRSAGVDVLLPTALAAQELRLRAVVGTPTPTPVTKSSFSFEQLLEFDWEATLGGEPLSEAELHALAEAKRPLVRLRGQWVLVDPGMADRLRRRRRRPLGAAEALAAALTGTLTVNGEQVDARVAGPLEDLSARLARLGEVRHADIDLPDLHAELRPYQRTGVAWMAGLTDLGLGGCLADDMGLGKTLQTIALHLHRGGPTLVVCPASLLGNWEREIERFAPSVNVVRYHGGARSLKRPQPGTIVLATYGVVRRDRASLAKVQWDLVVADEAQHVKNPLAATARELRAIPTGARMALTGTPVENRLTELWAILDWACPGLLGPLDAFRRNVAVPVERYRDPDATARFAAVLRPFLLRRRKIDPGIAPELPAKTEHDVIVPLTTEQVTLYEAAVREAMAEITSTEGIQRRGLVLKMLTELKQICNHPAQLLRQQAPLEGRSGKLAALEELLDVIIAEGDSTLVFTQYVGMARLLEARLSELGIDALLFHGGLSPARRDTLVDRFQAGESPVLILSLKAGGTGLNLTRATHVVHYDRWWNPAVEDQATDRAYRIGQDRPVLVHRLVTEGTIEDRIAGLLGAKRDLADAVVGSGESWLTELNDDELADLVALGGGR